MAANRKHRKVQQPEVESRGGRLAMVQGGLKVDDDAVKLLFDRIRLTIVSTLAIEPVMPFPELARQLQVTDGNLSTHAAKLEKAGLIQIRKRFHDKRPRTEFSITPRGRKSLVRYLDHMEAIIQATSQ